MEKFEKDIMKTIIGRYRKIWAVTHCISLMGWDSETYMPREGVRERSVASAEMSTLYQELLLSEEFVSLVERASNINDLNPYEAGTIRVLKREITKMKRLPPELIYELEKITSEAFQVWKVLREEDRFDPFVPYLKKILELNRKMADKLGYDENPYDALLDLSEEGLHTRDVKSVFDNLSPALKGILVKVNSEGYFNQRHALEDKKYDETGMKMVNDMVLELLQYPKNRARIDVSPHPFTIGFGLNDVRITTRYEGYDFKRSLFSTIHEFGHATYELQIDNDLDMTPIGTGVSLGIHEGQSRFWENVVGRSPAFAGLIKPLLDSKLKITTNYSSEELYRYFASVRPSLIRTEADEVTYNLHIALRFNLELKLINGELSVEELPQAWAEESESLLGVKPKNYANGVLQDVHWSHGSFGYF
ncbi:MAG: carboxypeptidase M32, partial [Nitrososphaeria archaeon]